MRGPLDAEGRLGGAAGTARLKTPGLLDRQKEDVIVDSAECNAEIMYPPCGAWDFPMSRSEKVRRLLLVFEAEVRGSEQEITTMRQEKEALRERAKTAEATAEALAVAAEQQRARATAIAAAARAAQAAQAQATEGVRTGASGLVPPSPLVSQPSSPAQASPPGWSQPLPAVPRTRRRTTIFAVSDSDAVVRIPRRTAPPLAGVLPTSGSRAEHLERCWEGFADGSDDDAITPRSQSSVASARQRRASIPLTTPDGIQIVVQDVNAGADSEWQELLDTRTGVYDEFGASPFGSRASSESRAPSTAGADTKQVKGRRASPRSPALMAGGVTAG